MNKENAMIVDNMCHMLIQVRLLNYSISTMNAMIDAYEMVDALTYRFHMIFYSCFLY